MKKIALLLPVAAALLTMGCKDYLCLAPPGTTANTKLSICHATGRSGKYELISVKASAAQAHVDHGDFLAPAGAKKSSDCVLPPPPPQDTVVTPPPPPQDTVVTPPPPVDTVPPVVVPPVVVPPVIDTTPPPPPPPPAQDRDDDAVKEISDEDKEILDEAMPCLFNDSRPECLL